MSKIAGELNAEIMKKVIHDRRAKLFAEIVAKTGSKQSVIDRAMQEIESLREQVEKLTKERDDLRSRRCEVCGYLEHEREHTGCLREQLAALAEQNEKMKDALKTVVDDAEECTDHDDWTAMLLSLYAYHIASTCIEEINELPDLASPVLNRIRAEGVRKASTLVSLVRNDWASAGDNLSVQAAEYLISALDARAAELEKTND